MIHNEIVNNGRIHKNEVVVTGSLSPVQIRLDQRTFPRIKNLPCQEVIEGLVGIVGTAFMYSGRQTSKEDVVFIASNLYQELMNDEQGLGMSDISLAEIGRCIKKSVLGQGREMFGISLATLYAVIADYCKGEGHMACKEIERMTQAQRMKELKQSAVGAMIESAVGEMIKSHKI